MTVKEQAGNVRNSSFHGGGIGDGSYLVRRGEELYHVDRSGNLKLYTIAPEQDSDADCIFNYQYAFEGYPENQPDEKSFEVLGANMRKTRKGTDIAGSIPSGYTYFGQFIFHDITWFNEDCESDSKRNRASAQLDMDSVLGNSNKKVLMTSKDYFGCPLAIGRTVTLNDELPEDLPRGKSEHPRCTAGLAHIPDLRNDNFLPLAQMHMLAIKFYNALSQQMGREKIEVDSEVRREFILHFQSVVLDDYLKKVIWPCVYDDVVKNGRRIVEPGFEIKGKFEIPIEFAAAAGRFGHSMIRTHYPKWNRKVDGNLKRFMLNTFIHGHGSVSCFRGLGNNWTTNWAKIFELDEETEVIRAARIDTSLSDELSLLPESTRGGDSRIEFNLAVETLKRQRSLNLASAEYCIDQINALARTEKILKLSPDQLINTRGCEEPAEVVKLFEPGGPFRDCTPIWFYILKEAELLGCGSMLGPLGSRLVMETMHAAIASADHSIVDSSNKNWKPMSWNKREFMISDLIKFSTKVNPLG